MLHNDNFEEQAMMTRLFKKSSGGTHILSQPLLSGATTKQYL
jgi:hypothetical protein